MTCTLMRHDVTLSILSHERSSFAMVPRTPEVAVTVPTPVVTVKHPGTDQRAGQTSVYPSVRAAHRSTALAYDMTSLTYLQSARPESSEW